MLKVGLTSLLVAVLGVVLPFAFGWGVGAWLLPEASPYVHAFLGATLTATSVGITARVLKDLGASRTQEARIILGAAVIDDVLGLIILGVVSGAITAAAQGAPFSVMVGREHHGRRGRSSWSARWSSASSPPRVCSRSHRCSRCAASSSR